MKTKEELRNLIDSLDGSSEISINFEIDYKTILKGHSDKTIEEQELIVLEALNKGRDIPQLATFYINDKEGPQFRLSKELKEYQEFMNMLEEKGCFEDDSISE